VENEGRKGSIIKNIKYRAKRHETPNEHFLIIFCRNVKIIESMSNREKIGEQG